MLVCNVSLHAPRAGITAEIAEAATATDANAIGAVFAVLVDDPASAHETVNAFVGQIMVEAASATATVGVAGSVYAGTVDAAASAADTVNAGAAYVGTIAETVTAGETVDGTVPVALASFDGAATNVTLSNGNLTATHSNTTSNSGVRSASQQSSGKYYFEVTATQTAGSGDCVGVITAAGTYTNLVTNGSNCGVQYRAGAIWANNANSTLSGGNIANGNIVGVAVDLDNDKIWFQQFFGWNGLAVTSENPATNTGGVSISSFSGTTLSPAVGFAATASGNFTANFGATTFKGNVPSGFSAWGGSTTFDGTATNATLTNGNLTAAHSNSTTNSGARSTDQRSSGKYYFEVTVTAIGVGDAIGLLTAAGTYTNLVTNATNCGAVYSGGKIFGNGSDSGKTIGSFVAPYILGIAVDLDNEKIWVRGFRWNGTTTHNPATNTGGASISSYSGTTVSPVVGFGGSGTASGDNFTANFGQSSYVMGLPAGFSNWPH